MSSELVCAARGGVQAFHPRGWSLICPHYQPPPAYTPALPCHDHDEGLMMMLALMMLVLMMMVVVMLMMMVVMMNMAGH